MAIATAIAFLVSSIFPIGAGLATNTAAFPKWWGVADVVMAFILALMAAVLGGLIGRGVSKEAEARSTGITWINCLTGFAWRAWLLLYTPPAWFTAIADLS